MSLHLPFNTPACFYICLALNSKTWQTHADLCCCCFPPFNYMKHSNVIVIRIKLWRKPSLSFNYSCNFFPTLTVPLKQSYLWASHKRRIFLYFGKITEWEMVRASFQESYRDDYSERKTIITYQHSNCILQGVLPTQIPPWPSLPDPPASPVHEIAQQRWN